MEKTWKGTTAGILTIVGGVIGIIAGALALAATTLAAALTGIFGLEALGGGLLAMGIIALIGGFVTLRRKLWGFALTSAILAMFPIIPLGIVAIIFVAKGKKEFS